MVFQYKWGINIVKYDVENMYSLYLVPFEYIIQIFEKVYMQLIC